MDDMPTALARVCRLLRESSDVAEVREASDPLSALKMVQGERFDAIFADISMPGLSGMEMGALLAKLADPPQIVFVTCYEKHAADAYDLGAVDYLRKPVSADRMSVALRKVIKNLSSAEPAQSPTPDSLTALPVESQGRTGYIRRRDFVVFVEACRDTVKLHTYRDSLPDHDIDRVDNTASDVDGTVLQVGSVTGGITVNLSTRGTDPVRSAAETPAVDGPPAPNLNQADRTRRPRSLAVALAGVVVIGVVIWQLIRIGITVSQDDHSDGQLASSALQGKIEWPLDGASVNWCEVIFRGWVSPNSEDSAVWLLQRPSDGPPGWYVARRVETNANGGPWVLDEVKTGGDRVIFGPGAPYQETLVRTTGSKTAELVEKRAAGQTVDLSGLVVLHQISVLRKNSQDC